MDPQYLILGLYYGYPVCCIESFGYEKTDEQADVEVHKGYGFIPCPKHAKEVKEGKITLESLISGRLCNDPFPIDSTDKNPEEMWKFLARVWGCTEKLETLINKNKIP